jgi:sigma-B regulation protein RsbU (phosphoserine phosphatase)
MSMASPSNFVRNLNILNEIVENLNQAEDVKAALEQALARLVGLMGLQSGWIFLKDPNQQTRWAGKGYVLAAYHNLPPAMGIRRARAWKGACECQHLCNRNELTSAYTEVRCSRLHQAPGDRGGLTVHATAPLRSGKTVLGILNVAAPNWETFSEESLVLLANVGSQMGIVLERARLLDLIQEQRLYEQAVLLELSNQLLRRTDLGDLLNFLVERIPQLIGVDACAILLPSEDGKNLEFCAASGWRVDPVAAGRHVPADAQSAGGLVMMTQTPIMVEDFQVNDPTPWQADWHTSEGFRSHAVIPLLAEEQAIGVLMIDSREPCRLTENDLRLLRLMANQAAIAIEKVRLQEEELRRRRLEDELALGRQIQLSLLPESPPQVEGWEFAAAYRPARIVGGDFYDIFELAGNPNQLGLVMADVAGKGVAAALFMALSRSIIRTKSMTGRLPAAVLTRANRMIYKDSRSKLFLTAFYATLDLETGWLAYANGGHNYPLWRHAGTDEIEELVSKGIILGAFEQIELEEREMHLAPGDTLVFYTDGLTEAMNEDEQLFGEERFIETIRRLSPEASAQDLLEALLRAIHHYTGDTPQADDFTLLIVKRQPD